MKAIIIESKEIQAKKSGVNWTVVKVLVFGSFGGVELKDFWVKSDEINETLQGLLGSSVINLEELCASEVINAVFDGSGRVIDLLP